jgi:hypothetical protein
VLGELQRVREQVLENLMHTLFVAPKDGGDLVVGARREGESLLLRLRLEERAQRIAQILHADVGRIEMHLAGLDL